MTREWKPGDVAVATVRGRADTIVMHRESCADYPWATARGVDGWWLHDADEVADARPLVVIDPEDPEQVERLRAITTYRTQTLDEFQAALREFADPRPPRPDEPMGLGAVVKDRNGHPYTRSRNHAQPFVGLDGKWRAWDEIAAVKVLSEGVEPC